MTKKSMAIKSEVLTNQFYMNFKLTANNINLFFSYINICVLSFRAVW